MTGAHLEAEPTTDHLASTLTDGHLESLFGWYRLEWGFTMDAVIT